MHASLLRALRIVIGADSDPARQVLFANLMQARRSVRWAFQLHARVAGTWASAMLIGGYGVGYFLRVTPPYAHGRPLLAVAKHANARRQVERVCGVVGREHCEWVRTRPHGRSVLAGLVQLASPGTATRLGQCLRIVRTLDTRHGFLVACRASAAVGWYARTRAILAIDAPRAVLVSSDSNPEEVGFAAAAASRGIARVFVSHAYPTPFSPRLDFTLSILEGEAAVRVRSQRGPVMGAVVYGGVEGDSAPLDATRFARPTPVIGIFTPKAVRWPTLAAVIDDCRRVFRASRIVIRWHPSRLDSAKHLASLGDVSDIEESEPTAALADVARRCDWVIADENSNVHLPVLKLGIPTIVVKGLGLYPPSRSDMYGFAAAGVVFPPVTSIREATPVAVSAFFDCAWADRFRQYDASYLRPAHEIAADVRRAVWGLLDPVAERTAHA